MSILIKGNDMPIEPVEYVIHPNGQVIAAGIHADYVVGTAVQVYTPHGRLIDERDLCRAIIADCTKDERQKMFKIVESVAAVIEEEG